MTRKKLIAGNWKMNGARATAAVLAEDVKSGSAGFACDIAVCPPFIYLHAVGKIVADSHIALGGQNCSDKDDGAFTGDTSAAMLADYGCSYVIIGHSERRQYHGESDGGVKSKASKAISKGLVPIICVGETEAQRDKGETLGVISRQLDGGIPESATGRNCVIAYEPVWAIGTGKVATEAEIMQVHEFIRGHMKSRLAESDNLRIIYGGSVKPDNAAVILKLDNVDGALVGGASLKAADFLAIARAA